MSTEGKIALVISEGDKLSQAQEKIMKSRYSSWDIKPVPIAGWTEKEQKDLAYALAGLAYQHLNLTAVIATPVPILQQELRRWEVNGQSPEETSDTPFGGGLEVKTLIDDALVKGSWILHGKTRLVSEWLGNHYGAVYKGNSVDGEPALWTYEIYGLESDDPIRWGEVEACKKGIKFAEGWLENCYVNENEELRGFRPDNAWAVFVGSQTPLAFLACSPYKEPERATYEYIRELNERLDTHYSPRQLEIIQSKLARYIKAELSQHGPSFEGIRAKISGAKKQEDRSEQQVNSLKGLMKREAR